MNLSPTIFDRVVSRWGMALVFFAGILVFANTLAMGFVYDDFSLILELPLIRDIRNIPLMFTSDIWCELGRQSPYYRPMGFATFALDYAVWNNNPFGYHLVNTLLHGCVSVLVLRVAYQLSASRSMAFWAGMFFALHPVHSEAVAWISARAEILSCGFMLSAFSFYLTDRNATRITAIHSLAGVCYLFALMSKETSATLPLLIVLYEYAVHRNRDIRSLLLRVAPFAVAMAIYLTLRFTFLDILVWQNDPFAWRLWTSFTLVVAYIKSLLLPFDLKVFYDIPIQKSPYSTAVGVAVAILAAVALLLRFIAGRNRLIFFSLVWCGVVMLPVCGIVTLLNPTLIADRYLYIPSVGLAFVFGIAMNRTRLATIGIRRYRLIQTGGSMILILLALITITRNGNWRNQQTFIRNVIRDAPRSEFAHYNRALIARDAGRLDEAINEFNAALAIHPRFAEAHYSLGVIAYQQGRMQAAEAFFLRALEYEPRDIKTINNLGSLYASTGRTSEAARTFERGLAMVPGDQLIRVNLEIARKELARKGSK